MANEIYNTSWWGNALDTARTAGTNPDFFGSQMKLLTNEQDNLVTNGDFSNGYVGWGLSGNPSNYSVEVVDHDGKTNALHFTTPDNNSGVNQIILQSNKQYLVKFDLKVISGNVYVGKSSNKVTGGLLNPSEWTTYEEYWTSSDDYFRVYSSGSAEFYLDNVSVQVVRCDYDGVSGELVQNGSFNQIGSEEVSNGDFSQIGNEQVSNGDFSQVGSESLLNANFESSSGWNLSNDSSILNGELYADTGGLIYQSGRLTNGKWYKVEVNVTSVEQDGFNVYANGTQSLFINTAGIHILYIQAGTSNGLVGFNPVSHFIGVIRSFSFKEVGQNWDNINLANGWSIGNNTLNFTNASSYVFQNVGTVQNKHYKVVLDLELTSGTLIVKSFNSQDIFVVNTTGRQTLTGYFKEVDSNQNFGFVPSGSNVTGKIHSVSIKEVGQDWSFGTGWNMGDGKAVSNSSVAFQSLTQTSTISGSNGKVFKCNFTISDYQAGRVALYISGFINNSAFVEGNGDYEFYINVNQGTSGNVEFLTHSAGFTGSISNLSIKEVGQNWTISSGWSIQTNKVIGSATNTYDTIIQTGLGILNKNVRLTFDIVDYTSGTFRLLPSDRGDNLDERFSGNGSYTVEYKSLNNDFRFQQQNFVGGITNISVLQLEDHVEAKKCLADWIHRTALEDLKY